MRSLDFKAIVTSDDGRVMEPRVHDSTLVGIFAGRDNSLQLVIEVDGERLVLAVPHVGNMYGTDLTLKSIIFDITFGYFETGDEASFDDFLSGLPEGVVDGVRTYVGRLGNSSSAIKLDSSYGLFLVAVGTWKPDEVIFGRFNDEHVAASSVTLNPKEG